MKLLFLLALCLLGSAESFAKYYSYRGEFSQVKTKGYGCEDIFSQTQYATQLHFIGSSRKVVLHLRNNASQVPAFFHGLSLFGRYGWEDFRVTKTIDKIDDRYEVKIEGLVSPEAIFSQADIVRLDNFTNEVICSAQAEFAAWKAKQ